MPWESFRAGIEAVVLTPDELKKSSTGRKPFDAILMFRMLVLQALNNLSDEQVEYQVRDRLSIVLALSGARDRGQHCGRHDALAVPRETGQTEMIEKLFDRFDQHLAAKGYMARGGQIIDASIVLVPTQRNSRDENAELQAGQSSRHQGRRLRMNGRKSKMATNRPPTADLLSKASAPVAKAGHHAPSAKFHWCSIQRGFDPLVTSASSV